MHKKQMYLLSCFLNEWGDYKTSEKSLKYNCQNYTGHNIAETILSLYQQVYNRFNFTTI